MSGPKRKPLSERFWTRVDKRGDDQCWPWTGKPDAKGYGSISVGGYGGGSVGAHRVSWEIANEAPAGERHILHRCDNPICVNPGHLYAGTREDNMADMKSRGRARLKPGPLTVGFLYVQSYRDHTGTPRFYFRRKGHKRVPLPHDPASPEFMAAYTDAMRTLKEPV